MMLYVVYFPLGLVFGAKATVLLWPPGQKRSVPDSISGLSELQRSIRGLVNDRFDVITLISADT